MKRNKQGLRSPLWGKPWPYIPRRKSDAERQFRDEPPLAPLSPEASLLAALEVIAAQLSKHGGQDAMGN